MRLKRALVVFALAITCFMQNAPSVLAAPPAEHGTAPVANQALPNLGQIVGNDISAMAACTIGGHKLLFIGGDVTGWKDATGTHPVSHLFAVDQATTNLVWTASSVGPDNGGWVQSLSCYTYDNGNSGRLYVGGGFTTFMGVARQHTAAVTLAKSTVPGGVAYGLAAWTVPTAYPVRTLTNDTSRVYVGEDRAVVAVGHFNTTQRWQLDTNCGVMTLLSHGTSVYAGGFFTKTKLHTSSTYFNQYGLIKNTNNTGKLYTGFKPTILKNEKLCNDPTATGHETYSGSIPLSLAWDTANSHLCVTLGGIVNRVGCANPTTGKWIWSHRIDGDGQTATIIGSYLFTGFHRSGGAITTYKHNYGSNGAFFSLKTGVQAHWALDPDFSGIAANRDGRNDGIISSVVIGNKFCVGGGFTAPQRGFACFAIK